MEKKERAWLACPQALLTHPPPRYLLPLATDGARAGTVGAREGLAMLCSGRVNRLHFADHTNQRLQQQQLLSKCHVPNGLFVHTDYTCSCLAFRSPYCLQAVSLRTHQTYHSWGPLQPADLLSPAGWHWFCWSP